MARSGHAASSSPTRSSDPTRPLPEHKRNVRLHAEGPFAGQFGASPHYAPFRLGCSEIAEGNALDRVHRRLATVLAADAGGYSRPAGRDEEGTLATLRANRQIIDRVIERHKRRVFGSAGDSVIAEFASPVEAVRCATEIQFEVDKQNAELSEASRLRFRIGINLGDVVVEGDNLMGDGVNFAARLKALSHPGGICISEAVYAQARDRLSLEFIDLGEHRMKNIARPVHASRVPLPSEEQVTSPFRGLNPFEFENADLFFGRARAIWRLHGTPWRSKPPMARHSCSSMV